MLLAIPFQWTHPSTWPWPVWVWAGVMVAVQAKRAWVAYNLKRPKSWPSVLGRIEEATVRDPKRFLGMTLSNNPAYIAQITYSYGITGQTYSGTYQREFDESGEAGEFLRELKGKPVTVHYNPAKPAGSSLLDSSLEEVFRLKNGGSGASLVTVARAVPAWLRPLLWPVAALSLVGFALSLYVHINALMGRTMPGTFWALHVGIFVVWFPAMFVAQRLAGKRPRKDLWEIVLRGAPVWMKYVLYCLFGYAFINSLLMWQNEPGKSLGLGSAAEWRGFSAGWMCLYFAAFAISYAGAKSTASYCVNGHALPPGAASCPQCGQALSPG